MFSLHYNYRVSNLAKIAIVCIRSHKINVLLEKDNGVNTKHGRRRWSITPNQSHCIMLKIGDLE